ncbi:MAG: 30S ribosomal protein S6 [Myxococcota bacterium]|nr:30S ribosomal protein S6 [Myxococcota bacterium]
MIYNEYETTYITRPELSEDVLTRIFEKLSEIVTRFEGELFVHDGWGRRKLAYPIRKHNHGIYIYLNYVGPADLPKELERIIRLDDQIIRFLTVKLNSNVQPDETREASQARSKSWIERRIAQSAERDRDRRPASN